MCRKYINVKCSSEIAIRSLDEEISYAELRKEVCKRERYLSQNLNQNQNVIALCMNRGIEYIYWIFAILQSGKTFLPIGYHEMHEKKEKILKDANPDLILVDDIDYFSIKKDKILMVKNLRYSDEENSEYHFLKYNDKNRIAYIIYTSGTTGVPKGVKIPYKALWNFLDNFLPEKMIKGEIILANTTFLFDIAMAEIILPIFRGGSLYITNEQEQKNVRVILKLFEKYKFDWVQFTPTFVKMLIQDNLYCGNWKYIKNIIIGGEMVSSSLVKLIKKYTKAKVYNAYGPTEATIWSHFCRIDNKNTIVIGKPIKNVEEFILDDYMNEVQKGKLWLAGRALSTGYLNDEQLTKKKFLIYKGKKIYDTGDVACKTDFGIQILGRSDNQIKISGKRLELEELNIYVEKLYNGIVLNIGNKIYVLLKKENEDFITAKKRIKECFPTDVKISGIYEIPEFPVMDNGKMDLKMLKETIIQMQRTEEKLIKILNEYTDDAVSKKMRMFEVGLDSIEYVEILVKCENAFGITFEDSKLVMESFETVEELLHYIEERMRKI